MRLKEWARALKLDALTLWVAARDPRTPWAPKLLAAAVAGYAFSPIDLIPDFIPVLGLLDDVVIVPLGVWAAMRLIPKQLVAEFRTTAEALAQRPISKRAAGVIVVLWIAVASFLVWRLLG